MRVFEPASIGSVELSNRIIRSATFEGRCDTEGWPTPAYQTLYGGLASQGLGAIITGFAYVSVDGKAMQPGQAGLEADEKVPAFAGVTAAVHQNGGRIFLQLAHAGRQTSPAATGGRIYAPSAKQSSYFNWRPSPLSEPQIEAIIRAFATAARRARDAGFDGVQLHAAHGYLIHQFLHPAINHRADAYGIDAKSQLGTAFLERIISEVRAACGFDYPLLIKISSGDSYRRSLSRSQFIQLVRFLDSMKLDGIEISFGTMDHAFNIFRGESVPLQAILDYNPRYRTRNALKRWFWTQFVLPNLEKNFHAFSPMYNLPAARLAKARTRIPIISVGGFRRGSQIRHAVEEQGIDFVSLCRPILCEPDFARKLQRESDYESRCANCNRCAVMCDSGFATRCYGRKESVEPAHVYEN